MIGRILQTRMVRATSESAFNESLSKAIHEMQAKQMNVEIHYGTAGGVYYSNEHRKNMWGLYFSAVLIGRKDDPIPRVPVTEELEVEEKEEKPKKTKVLKVGKKK